MYTRKAGNDITAAYVGPYISACYPKGTTDMNTVGLYLASTVGLTPIFSFYLGAFANLRKATISFEEK